MAHFKAYFHAMAVGTSNNCAINIKIMTITLQIEANGKFGKEKIKKTVIVLNKTFRKLPLFIVLYMVGKLVM